MFKKLNQHALLHKPFLWAIKPWQPLAAGLLATLATVLLAYMMKPSDQSDSLAEPYLLAVPLGLISFIGLVFWAWKANIFRPIAQFGLQKPQQEHKKIWIYFIVAFFACLQPWLAYHQIVYQNAQVIDQREMIKDIDLLNKGNMLLPTVPVQEPNTYSADHVLITNCDDTRTNCLNRYNFYFFTPSGLLYNESNDYGRGNGHDDASMEALLALVVDKEGKFIENRQLHTEMVRDFIETYDKYNRSTRISTPIGEILDSVYAGKAAPMLPYQKDAIVSQINDIAQYQHDWEEIKTVDGVNSLLIIIGLSMFLAVLVQTFLWATLGEFMLAVFSCAVLSVGGVMLAALFDTSRLVGFTGIAATIIGFGKTFNIQKATAYKLSDTVAAIVVQMTIVAMPSIIWATTMESGGNSGLMVWVLGGVLYVVVFNQYFARLAQRVRALPKEK